MKRNVLSERLDSHGQWIEQEGRAGSLADFEGLDLRDVPLSGVELSSANLKGANLSGADLWRTRLSGADLTGADLRGSTLEQVDLQGAVMIGATLARGTIRNCNFHLADLSGADVSETQLLACDFSQADLRLADFQQAEIRDTNFRSALFTGTKLSYAAMTSSDLSNTEFHGSVLQECLFKKCRLEATHLAGAKCYRTSWIQTDMSHVKGLEEVVHLGPSELGLETLLASDGCIPVEFLLGCGVHQDLVRRVNSFVQHNVKSPLPSYAFYLYAGPEDAPFCLKLCSRLREEGLRIWNQQGHTTCLDLEQLSSVESGSVSDKVVLVLSKSSLEDRVFLGNIRRLREKEVEQGRRGLVSASARR